MIDMMVREDNKKTIYTVFENFRRLVIIPDSEFKINSNESSPIFTVNLFLEFVHPLSFIAIVEESKILFIQFPSYIKIYNIEEDPLSPKFIKSFDFCGFKIYSNLKLDENSLLI
jgi:hypothetical protein